MKHPYFLAIILIIAMFPLPVFAADDTVEKTICKLAVGYQDVDEIKADLLVAVKREVINELFGEMIVASTAVENFVVTSDQIRTSSIGFVRVEGNADFVNGKGFAEVCVTIHAYVTDEDRAKFDPEKLENKYCDADDNLTTAQLIAYVKDESIIQALIEYNPKLKGADKDSLLQLVQKVTYLESDFISDTQTYCATFEGYVVPVEVTAFLETDSSAGESIAAKPYDDEFDGPSLNPNWYWIRETPTHWSLTSSPNYFHIVTQSKDIFQSGNTAPLLLQPPPLGDFDIVTRIAIAPSANYDQGGLIMYGNDDNYIRLTYGYFGGRKFEFGKEVNGKFESVSIPAPTGDNFHLRILKSGQNFSSYYSQDGSDWIIIGKYLDVKIAVSQIGLTAFSHPSSIEISADFDFFHVTCVNDC